MNDAANLRFARHNIFFRKGDNKGQLGTNTFRFSAVMTLSIFILHDGIQNNNVSCYKKKINIQGVSIMD